MKVNLNELYRMLNISKQAVHQQMQRDEIMAQKQERLLENVDHLRSMHPGCGVEKMYYMLQPDWIGRDRFIEFLMRQGYRIKKQRNYSRTTVPAHYKYPNLIEGMLLSNKNQVWQTDITYYRVKEKFYYLIFIEDVYTRRILSYQVSNHMRAEANITALKKAFAATNADLTGLIHHSDRGSQYIDQKYTAMLKQKGIQISMGLIAQDNAYAERVNGVIKNEYLNYWDINSEADLRRLTGKAVRNYNKTRWHRSLPKSLSPEKYEEKILHLTYQKRPKVIIHADGNKRVRLALSHPDSLPEKDLQAPICPLATESDCLTKTVNTI